MTETFYYQPERPKGTAISHAFKLVLSGAIGDIYTKPVWLTRDDISMLLGIQAATNDSNVKDEARRLRHAIVDFDKIEIHWEATGD